MPSATYTRFGTRPCAVSAQQTPVTTASTGTGQIRRTATGAMAATASTADTAVGRW
jgi:hypothetical protein